MSCSRSSCSSLQRPAVVSRRPHTSAYVRIRHVGWWYKACLAAVAAVSGMSCSSLVSGSFNYRLLQCRKHASKHAFVVHSFSSSQHTSAYVRIRPYTSAYVRIRQHTSAYVRIRQHTACLAAVVVARNMFSLVIRFPVRLAVYLSIYVHMYMHVCTHTHTHTHTHTRMHVY
jgi:hypothetical protein